MEGKTGILSRFMEITLQILYVNHECDNAERFRQNGGRTKVIHQHKCRHLPQVYAKSQLKS